MKYSLKWALPVALATAGFAGTAIAQDVPPPPPADAAVPPPAEPPAPPEAPAEPAPPPAAEPAPPAPPPPPAQQVMAPPAALPAPPPAQAEYPVCSKTVTDNCVNPSERAKTKRAAKKPRR